jgi:hypothetical protein
MGNVLQQRQTRRAFRDDDPLGSALIQSVEDGGRTVHRPYREDESSRIFEVAASVETLPQRWDRHANAITPDTPNGVRLSLGSLVYRGPWFDGREWCVRFDDAPPAVVSDEVAVS